jgi:hypothetical protein
LVQVSSAVCAIAIAIPADRLFWVSSCPAAGAASMPATPMAARQVIVGRMLFLPWLGCR